MQKMVSDFSLRNAAAAQARGRKMMEKGNSGNWAAMPDVPSGLTALEADGNMKAVVNASAASNGGRWLAAPSIVYAEVAELADALHSGCSARQGVEVRVLSSAPGFRPFRLSKQFRQPAIQEFTTV